MESNIFDKTVDQLKKITDRDENWQIIKIRDNGEIYFTYQTGCYGIKDRICNFDYYFKHVVFSHHSDVGKYNLGKMFRKLADELMKRASNGKYFETKGGYEEFLFFHLYREMVGKTILAEGRKRIEI